MGGDQGHIEQVGAGGGGGGEKTVAGDADGISAGLLVKEQREHAAAARPRDPVSP